MIDRDFDATALPTQGHERRVHRDSREPGGETGSFLEILDVHESVEERVLERVLRILSIPGDSVSDLKNFIDVTFAEFHERTGTSGLCNGDQHLIAHLRCTVFDLDIIYR